ncbi:TonB-dependent receptor domain-containing protein [Sphingomonas sp. CLY1604]|uniref:TonB-dependent receptor domain-containing protein n=1 Tax=Sphingomonas sp. CLY1604 TaxID=3457786 RepID=UPI003FD7B5DC
MKRIAFKFVVLAAGSALACAAQAQAQEGPQAQDGPSPPEAQSKSKPVKSRPLSPGEIAAAADRHANADPDADITVTGSRLEGGDPTTRLTVITAEEIKAKGVTSVAELIRTLPQNLSTIGAITNNRTQKGPLVDQNRLPLVSGVGALGVSAANLGGVGAGNTLVLVNGRRMAAAAGIESGFVNLNGIPLAAIERVEISLGGQAAIYGADALGGVINFILKSNYVGTTVSAQRLLSSGGANVTRLSGYSGYGWRSGNVSATVDYTRQDPIVNAKTGYVTNNYAPLFGGNPLYDKRNLATGRQPAVIIQPAVYDPDTGELLQPETGLTVPTGFQGRPGIGDFVTVGLDSARDYVPEYAGPFTDTISGTLNVDQKITDTLSVFATGLITRATNTQLNTSLDGLSLTLAPGQYYNPFPAGYFDPSTPTTTVYYYPAAELAAGTVGPGRITNVTTTWSASTGLRYDPSKSLRVELSYTASSSRTTGSGSTLSSPVIFAADPRAPNGFRCSDFALDNGLIPASQLAAYRAAIDRQCLALSSSDPAVAFNPFKSTASGGGSSVTDFLFVPSGGQDSLGSILHDFEAHVTGRAFKLPAGSIRYALGGEYVHTSTRYSNVSTLRGLSASPDRYALFAEVTMPIFGGAFTLPLLHRLELTAAARRDSTSVTGPIGTVDDVPIDQGGKPILATNRFTRVTPSAGVLWSPVDNLDLRAKFTTGFKAPPPTRLFNPGGSVIGLTAISGDPLYTCTSQCNPNGSYAVPLRLAPNPDLKPETSTQWIYSAVWHPSGPLGGLNLALTYNRNQIRNQIADLRYLSRLMNETEIYRLPLFYPRDASGRIIEGRQFPFNVAGSTFESLTFEASYLFYTTIGSFEPRAVLVRNLHAEHFGLSSSSVIDDVGTILGPDRYKLNGSLLWNVGRFTTSLFVYHTPSYRNDYLTSLNAGRVDNPDLITRVSPLTTVDLSVNWAVRNNLSVQFSGRNILKARAPFTVVENLPYDTARYDVAGRTLALQVQLGF